MGFHQPIITSPAGRAVEPRLTPGLLILGKKMQNLKKEKRTKRREKLREEKIVERERGGGRSQSYSSRRFFFLVFTRGSSGLRISFVSNIYNS